MILSLNWIKQFTEVDGSIDELTKLIGTRLVEIENVTDLGAKYQGIIVAKIMHCEKIVDSDHLNLTLIDDGGVATGIERDDNGFVQVVCGAPNVREGMLVAWLPPGCTVPESIHDKEPFVLGARKLRGYISNGMLASAKELDLFDDHAGILEIDKEAAPGSDFAQLYELNDYLFDIENKSLTHRPDCFGVVGFAREIAAISGKQFTTPDWLQALDPILGEKSEQNHEQPMVTIDDVSLSERYQAVVLAGAQGDIQSPLAIQTYLSRVGVRPISAVVDTTNYLMLLTGQPLHAFDYDKVIAVGGKPTADIHVRSARDQESLELLDGRTITMVPSDIVIASGDTAIGLAGAMGGANTEIDSSTKTIIIESATFNLYNLRSTQMRHGIFSEAITRFTKGQPAELTAPVLASAVRLIMGATGAERVSDIVQSYPVKKDALPQQLKTSDVNALLGTDFSTDDIARTLGHAEFIVSTLHDGEIEVTAPYWRGDIHIIEDVVEEVGRIHGFDTIQPTLPQRNFTAVTPSRFDELRMRLRELMVRAGANEVLSYSFVHGKILERAGQKTENSYRITNSISPELQYYRQTLTPSLLSLVQPNIKAGYDDFALYEMNKTHNKVHTVETNKVPDELDFLALTITHKRAQTGATYYDAKKILDFIGHSLGLVLHYDQIEKELDYPVTAPYDYRRSALVTDVRSGEFIGIIGEYTSSVIKNFKLPQTTAGFEIGPGALLKAIEKNGLQYEPLSRYPSTDRDVCFQVEEGVRYQSIVDAATRALSETSLITTINPLDSYQADATSKKNVTIRISFTAKDHTLTADEVQTELQKMIDAVIEAVQARVV
jgi:phenylalanyl-tRNA synthetase beta chain